MSLLVLVVAGMVGLGSAQSTLELFEHPDKNMPQPRFGDGAAWSIPSAGLWSFPENPSLRSFDNKLTSLVVKSGRVVLFKFANRNTFLTTLSAEPGFGLDPINLQPENDDHTTSLMWTPYPGRRHMSRRSLRSSRDEESTDYADNGRSLQAWGEHSLSSKLVLYDLPAASFDNFNRGASIQYDSCFSGDLPPDFDDKTSSLVICGARIVGYRFSGRRVKMFEVQARQSECVDVTLDSNTLNRLSYMDFNVCGCNLEC